jgi:prevent-host-death family protein
VSTISVSEARAYLSRLLDAATQRETMTITKRGVPAAQLVPPPSARGRDTAAVIQALLEFQWGITLGEVSIRELIEEGR